MISEVHHCKLIFTILGIQELRFAREFCIIRFQKTEVVVGAWST